MYESTKEETKIYAQKYQKKDFYITLKESRHALLFFYINISVKIIMIVPMKKYTKNTTGKTESTSEYGQGKKKPGKTLIKGYVNRNNQENYGLFDTNMIECMRK